MRRPFTRPALATAAALLALTTLAACGSDDGDETATTPTPTTQQTDASDEPTGINETAALDPDRTVIEVTMTGGKVEPPPGPVDVEKGQKVRIIVTRDTDGELHVHGLEDDVHADAKAGEPTNLDFVASQTGSFEVEAHDPDRSLLTIQVR